MKHCSKILLSILCVVLMSACSSRAVYTDESFATDSPFKKKFDDEVAPVCESARRSLLGQGYLIENADSDGIKARKALKREDNPNTFIEMNIVCLPETRGTTLFATGLLSTYALKKSSSSASVGVSALGSISLPIGQSADSLVKVSEETIDDKEFYQRFFAAVGNILDEKQTSKASREPEAITEAITTEPAQTPAEPAATEVTDEAGVAGQTRAAETTRETVASEASEATDAAEAAEVAGAVEAAEPAVATEPAEAPEEADPVNTAAAAPAAEPSGLTGPGEANGVADTAAPELLEPIVPQTAAPVESELPPMVQPVPSTLPEQVSKEPAAAPKSKKKKAEAVAEPPPAPVSDPSEWHYDE